MTSASTSDTVSRAAGRALNGMRLHHVTRIRLEACHAYLKRRRVFTDTLLLGVNVYLRAFGLQVRFLRGAAWRQREVQLHATLNDATVTLQRRGLLLPEGPGEPLDEVVRSGTVDRSHTTVALVAALRALTRLHQQVVDVGDGPQALSHGDAVLRNVLFDRRTGTAHWIDFETRHVTTSSSARRHAADLWTFARSAVFHLGASSVDQVASLVSQACSDSATRAALQAEIVAPGLGARLFHLAQAPLSASVLTELRAAFGRQSPSASSSSQRA